MVLGVVDASELLLAIVESFLDIRLTAVFTFSTPTDVSVVEKTRLV